MIETIKTQILNYGSDSVEMFGGKFTGGIFLQQHPDEISGAIEFLLSRGPFYNLLEVGAAAGANSFIFATLLGIKNIFIIDDNQHSKHVYRSKNLKDFIVQEFIGDSQSSNAEKFAEANGPFDIIYIDADHSFNGVTNDINNYKTKVKSGGFLCFHDALAFDGVARAINNLISEGEYQSVYSNRIKFGVDILQRIK